VVIHEDVDGLMQMSTYVFNSTATDRAHLSAIGEVRTQDDIDRQSVDVAPQAKISFPEGEILDCNF